MSDDDEAAALARLQAALDRIAKGAAARPAPAEAVPDPRLGEVRDQLDMVIARLRDALGGG